MVKDPEGVERLIFPEPMFVCGDLQDASAQSLIKGGGKTAFPDVNFMVPAGELAELTDYPARTEAEMFKVSVFLAAGALSLDAPTDAHHALLNILHVL